MLMSKVQAASLEARKAKQADRAAVLVTLYAEIQKVGKDAGNRDTTDEEAVRVVKKFLKGVDEFLAVSTDDGTRARLELEKEILESFLPTQADEATLRQAIGDVVSTLADKGPKSVGVVMKALKERFGGNYDGNLASKLVREALAA
jgi:uncharacterized protein